MKKKNENELGLWFKARRYPDARDKLKKKFRAEVIVLSVLAVIIIAFDTVPFCLSRGLVIGGGGLSIVFLPFILIGLTYGIRQLFRLRSIEEEAKHIEQHVSHAVDESRSFYERENDGENFYHWRWFYVVLAGMSLPFCAMQPGLINSLEHTRIVILPLESIFLKQVGGVSWAVPFILLSLFAASWKWKEYHSATAIAVTAVVYSGMLLFYIYVCHILMMTQFS